MAHAVQVNARPRNANGYVTVKKVQLEESVLRPLFGIRQEDAAQYLGVSLSSLKSACRRLGINRWPYTRSRQETTASRVHSSSDSRHEMDGMGETENKSEVHPMTEDSHISFITFRENNEGEHPKIELDPSLYQEYLKDTIIVPERADESHYLPENRNNTGFEITQANEIQTYLWESNSQGIEATWLDWFVHD
eukprot:759523-Hanusia_phi.AAC.4